MPSYKLTYFNARGRAEPIRFLLAYMGQDYEDYRLNPQDWPTIKPKMPMGKVPVLEIDGKQLCQSLAISRYLGKQAKLNGKDDWEAVQIDMAVETLGDFQTAINQYHYDSNQETKAKKKETLFKETVPFYLSKLDDLVKKNGGYLANGALSWGDLYFIAASDIFNKYLEMDIFEKQANLKALKEKVLSIPSIKAWVEKRPTTDL